jgi:hypothetical protein
MSITFRVGSGEYTINQHPQNCPRCKAIIQANPVYAQYRRHDRDFQVLIVYEWLNSSCGLLFLGTAVGSDNYGHNLIRVEPITPTKRDFPDIIQTISGNFCDIYNEAYSAEQQSLMQICGMGYRKALEFLIKDYLIYLKPEDE